MVSICSSLQHSTSCLSVSGKKTDQNNISSPSSCKYFFSFFSQIFLHLANMWHYQNAHYTTESTHFINIWLKPKSHRNISACVSQPDKYVKRYYLQRILIEGAGDSDMARKELIVRLLFVQWLHIHIIVVYLTLKPLYSHHCC